MCLSLSPDYFRSTCKAMELIYFTKKKNKKKNFLQIIQLLN